MAAWERATVSGGGPGSRINLDGNGPDWARVLSPKFRLNDGANYAVVGFGALVSLGGGSTVLRRELDGTVTIVSLATPWYAAPTRESDGTVTVR